MIKGRENEFKLIYKNISNFINTDTSNVIYISGVPDSGKTFTIKNVIDEFKTDLVISFINCSVLKSPIGIYKEILNDMECYEKRTKNLQSLRHHLNTCKYKHLIVIDEIDLIISKNETHIYNLLEFTYLESKNNVMLILLSNTLGNLSKKVESRIGKNRINFKPYTAKQLSEITTNSNRKVVDFLSKKVAAASGDIRMLNRYLKESGSNIKEISSNIKLNSETLLQKFVKNLIFDEKVILVSLLESSSITVTDGYNEYKQFCKLSGMKFTDFMKFYDLVSHLVDIGIYKYLKNKTVVISSFYREEIENVLETDKIYVDLIKKQNNKKINP